ncbi:Na+/H+ antiporter subunit E [Anaerotignum sp. MB30-C6]|uniref:Na+/H+ antiporter subunit E n=1 Tax=Anaerotignum sp. MB30-C6 TaxID=3070814 RepID=UPI0027DE66BB|nr:Na+/H+ antiporter subunit E [Anaerotignum sp. MB30-C6]WMI80214.1 Na+/H+ antiporter subunit E [Anaerotignum sp. MB30-C6]
MFVLLFLLWIVFNGKITLEIVLFGLAICAWLYWFMCKYMDYHMNRERVILKNMPLYIKYLMILFREIVKSNLAVIRIILSPNKEIDPSITNFKTDIKTDLARVVLANSITLTPGTYTIQLEDDAYMIHALDKSFGKDLNQSVFVKELRKLEDKL